MVEMMVKSLRDQSLKTVFGQHWLVEGEVKRIQFKNMAEFDAMVELGIIKPAPKGAEESKRIPVFPSPVSEETGLPVALNDGEQVLELSNDPDEIGEPTFASMDIPNETTIAALEEKDLKEVDTVDELMEELEEDDPEDEEPEDEEDDWTSEIDHV